MKKRRKESNQKNAKLLLQSSSIKIKSSSLHQNHLRKIKLSIRILVANKNKPSIAAQLRSAEMNRTKPMPNHLHIQMKRE